jgi:hypothetical protein
MEEGEMSEAREDLAALEKASKFRWKESWIKLINYLHVTGLRRGRFGDQRRRGGGRVLSGKINRPRDLLDQTPYGSVRAS